jgi:hypothetical protein
MGLPPLQRQRRDRNQTATDDQVYERFKKRYVLVLHRYESEYEIDLGPNA